MNVLVERYQRRKYVNQPDSQMLYYVRQKSGTVRVMDINKLADAIEANSSLTAGDVKHSIEAFVEQLRLSLTQGDKVKIDGLGTFHITLSSEGAEKEKDCTVRNIRRVNVRFVADKALQLVNTSRMPWQPQSATAAPVSCSASYRHSEPRPAAAEPVCPAEAQVLAAQETSGRNVMKERFK